MASMNGAAPHYDVPPAWYGGFENSGNDGFAPSAHKSLSKGLFLRNRRHVMNVVPMMLCLFIPWGMFCAMYGLCAFKTRYEQLPLCLALVALGFLICVGVGLYAFQNRFRVWKDSPPFREPSWLTFLFLTLTLAWFAGLCMGTLTFYRDAKPFYDFQNLNNYTDIYPNRIRGQQIMDAGAIEFAEGTIVDSSKSMGFRHNQMFCVAPITYGTASQVTYDFWAVGTDCCSGYQADFHCSSFNDPKAKGGLRLLDDDARAFYRLAVQQAEATYNIKAVHPLFFTWVRDASPSALDFSLRKAFLAALLHMSAWFLIQLLFVVCATLAFSKIN